MQGLQYKVVLRGVPDVSSKSVQQESLTRGFQSIERECFTRVCQSMPQECHARVSRKSVPHDCPRRVSSKSVLQELLLMPSSISCSLLIVL